MSNATELPIFRTKICGITRAEDVEAIEAAGADAIGLNFYPKSKRYLPDEKRRDVVLATRASGAKRLQLVGVFVNESADRIQRIADECELDWIQLHGHEPPDFSLQLPGRRILRALGYGEDGLAGVHGLLAEMKALGCEPDGVLLDAFDAVQFGGTGRVLPWSRLQSELAGGQSLPVPWVLAGGLTAKNVRDAILALHPDAVDVASGVELAAGQKDRGLVKSFVEGARSAWLEINS